MTSIRIGYEVGTGDSVEILRWLTLVAALIAMAWVKIRGGWR